MASLKIPHTEGFNNVEYIRLLLYSYGLIVPEALSIILILERDPSSHFRIIFLDIFP